MTLYEKLRALYPALNDADFLPIVGTIALQDDGDGPYIAAWSHPALARPTDAQLAAVTGPTQADIEADYDRRVMARLDGFAQRRRYRDIVSLCSYATDPDPIFAAEGQRGVTLRSTTNRKCYELLGLAIATGVIPTWEEVEAQLPPLLYPDEDPM